MHSDKIARHINLVEFTAQWLCNPFFKQNTSLNKLYICFKNFDWFSNFDPKSSLSIMGADIFSGTFPIVKSKYNSMAFLWMRQSSVSTKLSWSGFKITKQIYTLRSMINMKSVFKIPFKHVLDNLLRMCVHCELYLQRHFIKF